MMIALIECFTDAFWILQSTSHWLICCRCHALNFHTWFWHAHLLCCLNDPCFKHWFDLMLTWTCLIDYWHLWFLEYTHWMYQKKRKGVEHCRKCTQKTYNDFNDSHKTRNSLVLIWLSWREWMCLTYDQIKTWVSVSTENAPVQFNWNLIHKFLNLFARMLM